VSVCESLGICVSACVRECMWVGPSPFLAPWCCLGPFERACSCVCVCVVVYICRSGVCHKSVDT